MRFHKALTAAKLSRRGQTYSNSQPATGYLPDGVFPEVRCPLSTRFSLLSVEPSEPTKFVDPLCD